MTPRLTGFAPTTGGGNVTARQTSPIVGAGGSTGGGGGVARLPGSGNGTHSWVSETTIPALEYAITS